MGDPAFLLETLEAARRVTSKVRAAELRPFEPLPHQVPPPGDWFTWLLLAGRGAGKSDAIARWAIDHVRGPACPAALQAGVPHRIAILAPTVGDGREGIVLGPSGLKSHWTATQLIGGRNGSIVKFPNGAEGQIFGAHSSDDIERLRAGGNRCVAIVDELAAMRYGQEAWDQMEMGLRASARPQVAVATTPKPKKIMKALVQADWCETVRASMHDNIHLPERFRQRMEERYAGTRLGRQEIYGELLDDVEGAWWTYEMIDRDRWDLAGEAKWSRVAVAVDPPGGGTEAGIVVAAQISDCPCDSDGPRPHWAVLEDCSLFPTGPDHWAQVTQNAYDNWTADRVLAETNYGGDMVEATLRRNYPTLPYQAVRATRGKMRRAEPIAALYEKRRVHHVGQFTELEDEMCSFVEGETDESPNRLDALVWALTWLSAGHTFDGDIMV